MNIDGLVQKARFTVLLGKNGAGKSTLLRGIDSANKPNIKYISPERGGTLKYDPHVDNNISSNANWLPSTRRNNRFEQFRQQSATQFRTLELAVLREIEQDVNKRADNGYNFSSILERINALLPAVKLVRAQQGFAIQNKSGQPIAEEQISSGESELIALAIEVLVFSRSVEVNKVLLMDEPDVHLHPDLQQKFIGFVESIAVERDLRVVIATHSTAIIAAFSKEADLQIVPVSGRDQTDFFEFKRTQICEEILPVFGAHPLSTAFNLSPIILVEGEDDRRVLEQMVRSSNGRVKFSPCVVGTVSALLEWENWLNQFLPVLYDDPKSYSLRDLDDSQQTDIDDLGVVCRIRLNCYAIENILLSDQCLSDHNFNATSFKENLQKWVKQYPEHQFSSDIRDLIQQFDQRRIIKIKNARNIIVALLGSNKPWEVIVGQLIAKNALLANPGEHSVQTYLGTKALQKLFNVES